MSSLSSPLCSCSWLPIESLPWAPFSTTSHAQSKRIISPSNTTASILEVTKVSATTSATFLELVQEIRLANSVTSSRTVAPSDPYLVRIPALQYPFSPNLWRLIRRSLPPERPSRYISLRIAWTKTRTRISAEWTLLQTGLAVTRP